MSDDEKTAEDMFGAEPPGVPVRHRDVDPCAGYTPKARWGRRLDGRPVRLDALQGRPETTLAFDNCPRQHDDRDRRWSRHTPGQEEQVPSYKSAFGSFLKQEDLQGKTPRVVIASVEMEDVKDNDSGKTEKKLVLHFSGKDKALILNRTNCETLEDITGTDDYGAWAGHTVVLWTDPTVKFGGKTVGGLRIRAIQAPALPPPPPPKPVENNGEVFDDEVPF